MNFAGALVLVAVAHGVAYTLCMRELLHLLQLESYQLPGYFRALKRVGWRVCLPGVIMIILLPAIMHIASLLPWWGFSDILDVARASAPALLCGGGVYAWLRKRPAKKALAFTPRMVRLFVASCIVQTLLVALLFDLVVVLDAAKPTWLPITYFAAFLLPLFNPLWVALTAWLVRPLEARVNRWFFQDAQRVLRDRQGLIRIGITGSYGKTSAKFLLATLLAERYNVLATPGSFNTPMGLARVIREQLAPEHQVFIAEMGARHVGDIRELCELVGPSIGLLTSVGPQHLETMGTIERVTETKYELIQSLPRDGAAFFGRGNEICERLFARCPLKEKHLAGERLRAEDIEVGPFGSRFTLVDGQGHRVHCQTKLLGTHNIDNLLLCAEAALQLGLTLDELAAGIAKLQPVEHRLQLIDAGNGVTVIDDAFNSNPAGAKSALDVLRGFSPARRIVITPGMVELGPQQDALNETFGRQMADSADIAILIGRRRVEPIVRGLEKGGFDAANLHVVSTLDESTALLATLARPGDAVLYENDLPENYAE